MLTHGESVSLNKEGSSDTGYSVDEPRGCQLSEISQTQKDNDGMTPLIQVLGTVSYPEMGSRTTVAGAGGRWDGELVLNGCCVQDH